MSPFLTEVAMRQNEINAGMPARCLTEISSAALVASALSVAALLWIAIFAVL
jgi:hypothetical protein